MQPIRYDPQAAENPLHFNTVCKEYLIMWLFHTEKPELRKTLH